MSKKKSIKSKVKTVLKWSTIVILSLVVSIVSFGFWYKSLLPSFAGLEELKKTTPQHIPYLTNNLTPNRGKILTVVTSSNVMGASGKSTGYELTELSRAYYVFKANGFDVDVASPLGGKPPVVIDWEDMGIYDFAFLNDSIAQNKVNNSLNLDNVIIEDYQAVFFVGGKGAMFDFPQNTKIQTMLREYHYTDKIIGAVCHGPAALINVTLNDGSSLLKDRSIASFTNYEELFLIPNAKEVFPFLLEDKLIEKGAQFNVGSMYLKNVRQDGNLVTGQNPWSTWTVAETMIKQMGYTPVTREITAEENTVDILSIYETEGYEQSKVKIDELFSKQLPIDRLLLAKHGIIAAMQWKLGKFTNLTSLLAYAKSMSDNIK